ncbi:MAG: DUF362 domain-containing protein, partial [Kiritimatiellota bacterium]|nr:DUF362 domain-containing protein [Kiritimatiellota bacterium]
NETVLIKMHTGNGIGYSTVHPVFVRKVVQAVKDGGGTPFIADVFWDAAGAETRGYTAETLGCPIIPSAGIDEKYFYAHERPYKSIRQWKVAGMVEDASFLINFAHAKGHPSNSYGGCFKNLALGAMTGETRSAIHDTNHYDPYWFPENCPDHATVQKIIESCPFGAILEDKERPGNLHLHFEPCNQCMRCLKVAPEGSLKIQPVNFQSFQEANAISVSITMSTFAPGKAAHLNLATQITTLCDCFGFTSMPILPDAGVFGSDDIVAIDQAVLDMTAKTPLLEDNIPTCMEVVTRLGHPLSWIHGPFKDPYKVTEYGEKLGLGSRQYELVDILPVQKFERTAMGYIKAG